MTDHLHPTPLLSTPLSSPHLPPSLISPSSVLSYPAVLLFSRGGRCWRSSEELSCAVCFFSPSLPSLPQPRRKGNKGGRSRRRGREAIIPEGPWRKAGQQRHVMERRMGHIKLPTKKKKRLDRRDRWIKGLTEERLTYYTSTRDFGLSCGTHLRSKITHSAFAH